eukprot:188115-Amphidinium_carterae.1
MFGTCGREAAVLVNHLGFALDVGSCTPMLQVCSTGDHFQKWALQSAHAGAQFDQCCARLLLEVA